jgi:hypothetical protein
VCSSDLPTMEKLHLDKYLLTVRHLYFNGQYETVSGKRALNDKREALTLSKKDVKKPEEALIALFRRTHDFLGDLCPSGTLTGESEREYFEFCSDVGLLSDDSHALLDMFRKKPIPHESSSVPYAKKKSQLGYFLFIPIFLGVGYMYTFYEIVIGKDEHINFKRKEIPSATPGFYKEIDIGQRVFCKVCGKIISEDVHLEKVLLCQAKSYQIQNGMDYCKSCGNEMIPYVITYKCERCNKLYQKQTLYAQRREEQLDRTEMGVCSSSCRGLPYTVSIQCEKCGRIYDSRTEYVFASDNSNPVNKTIAEGFCSDKCRIASKFERGTERASEAIGDLMGRAAKGFIRGVEKHAK